MKLTSAEQIAADFVWKTFSMSREWPDRHRLVLALDDAGFSLRDARRVLKGISMSPSYDAPSSERVRLTLQGWIAIDAARPLLRPLGQVVARLARDFVENPIPSNANVTGTPWSTFRDLWPAEGEWLQIRAIIRDGLGFPFDWSTQSSEESFIRPSFEILRFEHVQSLEDVIRILDTTHARTRVGRYPAGRHRAFLVRVFSHALCHHEWPSALGFAVRERDLGYVPDLQSDLSLDGYVRGDFAADAHARIRLRPESVASIDDSGEGRGLLLRVLSECRARWRRNPGADVTSAELSSALGVDEAFLKSWLLFFDVSDWNSGSTLSGTGAWSLRPNEIVLSYRDVKSWDEYLAVPNCDGDFGDLFERSGQGTADQQPAPPDLSSARACLRRLLCQDELAAVIERRLDEFDRVFAAQAWQAAMILLGSAMEGVLLDVLGRNAGKAESALPNRKRSLGEAGLGDLVHAAEELKLINTQVRALAFGLKEFRDLVHPNRAAASNWRPTPEAVRGSAFAFGSLVTEMESAIDDGRMSTFEKG